MTPFGFTPEDADDAGKNNGEESAEFKAMMAQMAAMQAQIQSQFASMGINPAGFSTSTEVLPKSIVRDTAKKFVTTKGSAPIGANDVAKVQEAFSIAELWLDEATYFPRSSEQGNTVLARTDWVDTTLSGWQSLVEPLALGLSTAIAELLKNSAVPDSEDSQTQLPMPVEMISAVLGSFIGSLLATQLGQSVGSLAGSVTGIYDVGLPLQDQAYPALVSQNIDEWGNELDIPMDEVRIFHALRESAGARLFAHNPWLVAYIRGAVSEYGKGIRIDIEAIQRQAQEAFEAASASENGFDPTNPESFAVALNSGIFTPEETPSQREALTKLETVLALVDGWNEVIVMRAAGDRLPNISALQETLRRRRATSAPTQQLFANLFGLEVSPRLAREAAGFWSAVSELRDVQSRDQIWSGILPSAEDLLTPEAYLGSIEIPDDLSSL
ncbi:MAG: hypothetical protein F2893_02030 [Actinobacteria bacterium]|uniref:Unannotated protein n=1 Tax=freshwater metagenome TaxID=449393 RepID=A0A6J6TJ56_9ZZZZ|nr:zinc-dependent metalloprotease [Actinomycetota bacterium]MSV39221.1 hypothetical protein [Actinomycetota bacterium]MSY48869.1 hypothetical protein [Actinomycetota bacterium]MTH91606.1 hypothetical protein [Actinomycetota bacterium]